jgi:hypothetical protein
MNVVALFNRPDYGGLQAVVIFHQGGEKIRFARLRPVLLRPTVCSGSTLVRDRLICPCFYLVDRRFRVSIANSCSEAVQ